jgi:hypothetical protein
LIPRTKRQKRKDSRQGERSYSSHEATIELSIEPVRKLENTHELNIQRNKKCQKKGVSAKQILEDPTTSKKERHAQSKETSPSLIPKYHPPQSEKLKRNKIGQQEFSHEVLEATIEFPQESVN